MGARFLLSGELVGEPSVLACEDGVLASCVFEEGVSTGRVVGDGG